MSSFEHLIPSRLHYYNQFGELDEIDLKIIFEMTKAGPDGPRNVKRIAKRVNLPQQTVNYRVQRYDSLELARFRAIIDEAHLGLTNYIVIAGAKPGLLYENKKATATNAGTFLTCYPVWRLLEGIRGGDIQGFLVQYSIPHDRKNDLRWFLDELVRKGHIEKADKFLEVTRSFHNNPSLDLLLSIKRASSGHSEIPFDWQAWAKSFDNTGHVDHPEEKRPQTFKMSLDFEDLFVLFQLECNLRESFSNLARSLKETPTKVAQRYKNVLRLVSGCRAEVNHVDPTRALHLVLMIVFDSNLSLWRFASHLDQIPYLVHCPNKTLMNC